MSLRAIAWSLIPLGAVAVMLTAFGAVWLSFPWGEINLQLPLQILSCALPALGGALAGALANRHGMLNGTIAACAQYLLGIIVLLWFAPQYLTPLMAGKVLLLMAACGCAGGLCGINLRAESHSLRTKK